MRRGAHDQAPHHEISTSVSKSRRNQSATRRTRGSRSASKPTTPLNRLRGAIGNRKEFGPVRDALDSVKNDGSPRDFERLYDFSLMSPMTAVAIAAAKPVKKISRIQSVVPLDTTGIHKEIAWVTTLLAANAVVIGKFVKLRNEYCLALNQGQYDKAHAYLDKIDTECGVSLWAIENRISIAALAGGFDRQKAYINSMLSGDRRTFVAFFASNIGERNESRVSKLSFETRLRERAKTWKIKSDQQTYVFFKLLGATSLTPLQAADILSFEAASSPVDLYETFLDVVVITKDLFHGQRGVLLAQLRKLEKIADHCLDNLNLLYSEELPSFANGEEYVDAFLSGHYRKALALIEGRLIAKPDDPLLMLIGGKLTALGYPVSANGNQFLELLLPLLGAFLQHDQGADEAAQSLERIALNFKSLAVSSIIESLISSASTDLIGDIPATAAVRSRCKSLPIRLSLLDESRKALLLASNPAIHGVAWQYQAAAHLGVTPVEGVLSSEAKSYAAASFSKKKGRLSGAFPHFERIATSENPYFQQQASILQAWCLHDDGDIEEAILRTVRSAISRPALLRSLPLADLFKHRGFRDLKRLEREPCLSIGFYLYAKLTRESTKDVALKVAWKQFHKAHGVTKPSELRARISSFDRNEILFFLRHVCTQEIMELSAAFNSPADLDRERLQICVTLSEVDPERSSDYDAEIIELTRRLSIEDGVQQVESSRVYVDLLGLQRWCHQHLNELFLRYIDYAGAGLGASTEELERIIVVIVKKTGVDSALLSFLDAYDINADSLLAELIEECAANFLNLPRFGLDAFLGSRVRHGSLEGAFRSPLEVRKLITKIDSSTNQYDSNTYWLNADPYMSTEQRAVLDKALNTFSSNIDSLLDTAISRFVHVRSAAYPDGLLWLWPPTEKARRQRLTVWLIQAKTSLSKEVTIEQFVDFCATSLFWPMLKTALSEAAEFITTTLAGQIMHHLDTLAAAAHKATPNHGGLTACVSAAGNDIQVAAAKVARWFAPPQFTNIDSTYLLKTGIEIGLTSLRHVRPQFTNEVEWDIDDRANVLLHSSGFQIINDVAFLIFGNIDKHSGFFDDHSTGAIRPKIQISLRWIDPNIVEVEVRNEISPTKDILSVETNVNSAKEQIRLGQFDSVARQKNKTGLVRLASVLNYENSEDKVLEFGVVDDSRFHVKFSLPVYYLTGQSK